MLRLLEKLRPAADTAAALAESIGRTEAALAEAQGRVAALEAARPDALFQGGATAERLEADLRAAREDAERLDALLAALRSRHEAAVTREARAALEAQAAEVARLCEEAGRDIARRYPKIAGELVALLAAEKRAEEARDALYRALDAAGPLAEGIDIPPPPWRAYVPEPSSIAPPQPLYGQVRLPKHDHPALGWHGSPMLW